MLLTKIILVIVFVLVFVFGSFIIVNYTPLLNGNSAFVKRCEFLYGQELSLSNIKKLNGWCYTGAERTLCEEVHIERLKSKVDPFHNISEKQQIDNTWECSVSIIEDNIIEAKPQYHYE